MRTRALHGCRSMQGRARQATRFARLAPPLTPFAATRHRTLQTYPGAGHLALLAQVAIRALARFIFQQPGRKLLGVHLQQFYKAHPEHKAALPKLKKACAFPGSGLRWVAAEKENEHYIIAT